MNPLPTVQPQQASAQPAPQAPQAQQPKQSLAQIFGQSTPKPSLDQIFSPGYKAPAPTATPSATAQGLKTGVSNIGQGIANQFSAGVQGLKSDVQGLGSSENAGQKVADATINPLWHLAQAAISPITGALGGSLKSIGDLVSSLPQVQQLANTPAGQKTLDAFDGVQKAFSTITTKYPNATKDIGSAVNLLLLALGGSKAPDDIAQTGEDLSAAGSKVADGASNIKDTLTPEPKGFSDPGYVKTAIDNSQNAIKIDDASLEQAGIPKDMVYQENGNLTPKYAQGRIDDVAQKLDKFQNGLGDQYRATIDVKNTDMNNIIQKGQDVLSDAIKTQGGETPSLGDKISTKVTDLVAPKIPKAVESALKETPQDMFDRYANIANKATESNKNPTPLEEAGNRAGQALDTIQRKLNGIGDQKSSILKQAGVGDKPVGNIVTKFRQGLDNYLSGKTAIEGDSKLVRDISSEAKKLGSNPTANQVDKFIDFAQDRIYSGARDLTVPVTDATTGAIRRLVGQLNTSLKGKLPSTYSDLNAKYADMVGTKNELNTKLGAEGEKGGALMKRVFSPSDANTKKLFAKVQKITGIDLVNEATIARYLQQLSGDVKQASMLEQLQLPKMTDVPNSIMKGLQKHFATPEKMVQRARSLTNASTNNTK